MRRAVVLSIAAVAAVAVGGAWLWLSSRPESPESAAERYLAALSGGDLDALDGLLGDAMTAELADRFANATGHIIDPRVSDRATDSATAAAFTATAMLDGSPVSFPVHLIGTGEGWQVDAGVLPTVTVHADPAPAAVVGGVVATAPVPVLPAVYDITAAPSDLFDGTGRIAVGTDVEVDLPSRLATTAATVLQGALEAHLEDCTRPASTLPPGCGLRVPWGVELASVSGFTFRVETYPTLEITDDALDFRASGGDLVITATGVDDAGNEVSQSYRVQDWTVRGIAHADGLAVELLVF